MRREIPLALLAATVLGCGSSANVVSGTVQVNNQPLQRGYVTFLPIESTKGSKGAPLNDGRFTLKDLAPGTWKVLISETPVAQVVRNSDGPPTLAIAPSALAISSETTGNRRIVEVRAGKQSLDFNLQAPGR
jgi:hypothetical protein